MRVLITNLFLDHNSGSETVAEILADGLRRAGHEPMLYATLLGPQAERMRIRGHFVTDRLSSVPYRPDVIHAQHVTPAVMAITAFPDTPVLNACHSTRFVLERPVMHPNVRRYVAVDDLCRDRCLADGVPADRLSVVLNAVDLERFKPRPALPERPRRALMVTRAADFIGMVRDACRSAGLKFDNIGVGSERFSTEIEEDLVSYDIVFATARGALEAAAIGCAVVVCDRRGFAGLLTTANLDAWRRLNFGAGLLTRPTSPEAILEAIAQYDAEDAAEVSRRVRAMAGLDDYVARHLELYAECLAEPVDPGDPAIAMAAARLLEDMLPTPTDRDWRELVIEKKLYPPREDEVLKALGKRIKIESQAARDLGASIASELEGKLEQLLEEVRGLSTAAPRRPSRRKAPAARTDQP